MSHQFGRYLAKRVEAPGSLRSEIRVAAWRRSADAPHRPVGRPPLSRSRWATPP